MRMCERKVDMYVRKRITGYCVNAKKEICKVKKKNYI